MDAKYAPANLQKIVDNLPQLDKEQQEKILKLLQTMNIYLMAPLASGMDPYKVELRDGVIPYHARPYAIPQAYEQTFKDKVEHLCDIGVIRKIDWSKRAAPTFLIQKRQNGLVYLLFP